MKTTVVLDYVHFNHNNTTQQSVQKVLIANSLITTMRNKEPQHSHTTSTHRNWILLQEPTKQKDPDLYIINGFYINNSVSCKHQSVKMHVTGIMCQN
jgi:hypothetical protein